MLGFICTGAIHETFRWCEISKTQSNLSDLPDITLKLIPLLPQLVRSSWDPIGLSVA